MKICIKADGGTRIGMGHIMRMSALARELEKDHDVFFACKVDRENLSKYSPGIDFLKNSNFKVIELNEDNIKNQIRYIEADCIITDSYDVDEEYFNILKDNFKLSGYIDDEMICEYFNVDFIINQNLYAENFNYKVNNDTKMMIGPEFVILRDEFRSNIKDKEIQESINDIMITVGGSDDKNLTERILKQIITLECTLHVVVGGGFKNYDELKKYESSKIILYKNANMKQLMEKCDICITGCGTTVYELCACKTPFIGISVAENQEIMFDFIKENRISRTSAIDNIKEEIQSFTYNERKEVSHKLGYLVNGKGISRIVYEINKILKEKREN